MIPTVPNTTSVIETTTTTAVGNSNNKSRNSINNNNMNGRHVRTDVLSDPALRVTESL